MNSYGIVVFLVFMMAVVSFFGSRLGFTVSGVPVEDKGTLDFILYLVGFQIDGLEVLSGVFILLPFLCGWIVYRQIRGQD